MNKIIEVKFGSHLYGTATEKSDTDYKGIYIPEARDIVLGTVKRNISTSRSKQEGERNTKDDVDREIFSLKEYLKLLVEGQTVALDILFSPESFHVYVGPDYHIFKHIFENKEKLLSRNVTAFYFYALRQAAKYGIKGSRVNAVKDVIDFLDTQNETFILRDVSEHLNEFVARGNVHIKYTDLQDHNGAILKHFEVCDRKFPLTNSVKYVKNVLAKIYKEYGLRAIQAANNEGIDFKACSHAVRVNFEAQELLKTGHITFPRPESDILLKIKTGQMPYSEVSALIENGLKELEAAKVNSTLRDSPDNQWAEDFVYQVYSDVVKGA